MELVQFKKTDIFLKPNKRIDYPKNILLVVYVLLETLYKTIFGMFLLVEMERLQCVIAAMLAFILLIEFIRLNKENKLKWICKHIVVFVYFAIRIITFINTDMQYTMLRSVFFEGIYLLVLTELIVETGFAKKILFRVFIISNIILNALNVFIYFYCSYAIKTYTYEGDFLYYFFDEYTYYSHETAMYTYSMYSNPNFMGMFTGLAIIIALNYVKKNMNIVTKILFGIYFSFSLYCIWLSNCSNAQISIIVVLFSYIAIKKMKALTRKRLTILCMVCCIIVTSFVFFIAATSGDNGQYFDFEKKLDSISTGRYSIWKDCYYSHKEEYILGCGNLVLEKQDRYEYNLDKGIDIGIDVYNSPSEYAGPHNGYIGMLSCTGIFGFCLYLIIIIKKIIDSKPLDKEYWYLAIIFILMVNLFECMVIINKNALCMYMFLILGMEERK